MKDPFDVFLEEDIEEDEVAVEFSYIPEIDDSIAPPSDMYEDLDDEEEDIDF